MDLESLLQLNEAELYEWCGSHDLIVSFLEDGGASIYPEVKPSAHSAEVEGRVQRVNIIKIANHICSLPNDSLLSLAYTSDLEQAFNYERALHQEIARCFIITGLKIDFPFIKKSEVKENKLRSNEHELLILRAEQIHQFWELIREGFAYIKDALKDSESFDYTHNPVELTCHLVEELSNNFFAQKAFEYCSFDTVAIAKNLGLVLENGLDTRHYNSKLSSLSINSKISDTVLSILERASLNDLKIRKLLEEYVQLFDEAEELRQSELIKRGQKGKVFKSHYWQNGVKYTMH